MKVVLDTNVLMSGIFWGGLPGKILDLWSDKQFILVTSKSIFNEYKRVAQVLESKYKFNGSEKILDVIAIGSTFVEPKGIQHPKCDDPDDDIFLAAAVYSHAKYIVSGDKALLRVEKYPGGSVISAQSFVELF